jgi:hypothetical protein
MLQISGQVTPLLLLLFLQASPFIEVQAARGGGCAYAPAALEHAHNGTTAVWAPGAITLERAGSHLVVKVHDVERRQRMQGRPSCRQHELVRHLSY